jgi:hypothetical protein
MPDPIGILDFKAETEAPIWFINHFLEITSSNYLKVFSLREICKRFQHGAEDNDFVIAGHSFELLPDSEHPVADWGTVIALESKGHSAANFWRLFKNLHRPVILFKDKPLFDPHSESALQLKELTLNSPLSVSLQGAVGALIDVITGKVFAQRDSERITISIQNVREIVETSRLIEDPDTPAGVQDFARDQLEALMNKQHRINQKLGVRQARIRDLRH